MDIIQKIRKEFVVWGYSLDDISDEEIINGVVKASIVLKSYGVSMSEAVEGMKKLAIGHYAQ